MVVTVFLFPSLKTKIEARSIFGFLVYIYISIPQYHKQFFNPNIKNIFQLFLYLIHCVSAAHFLCNNYDKGLQILSLESLETGCCFSQLSISTLCKVSQLGLLSSLFKISISSRWVDVCQHT